MESKERGNTILMLPWLGHGHISSFLELGKRLARKGLSIYLCSTPVNLISVKQTLENNPSIKTIEIHLPDLPELPPQHHTTNGLPPNLLSNLKKAFDMAAPNFSDVLQRLKPDLLIYDFIQFWAPQVALSQNVPSVFFTTAGAATCSYIIHKHFYPHTPYPFPEIYVKDYENTKYEHSAKVNHDRNIVERIISCARQSHEVVLVKSCNEIEGKYINYLSTLCKKTMLPVGPLVSETVDQEEDEYVNIFEWLNKKDKASTVFVSFGSECFLPKEEMEEIAGGLELSCVNFIWVVRFPTGDKIKRGTFLEEIYQRVGEKGMIIETWAPQLRILSHSSIGGFVSHCGWGSVMEAISFGVPIIAIPMQYDQPLNARVVQDAGIGEEVKRDRNGKLEMGEIAKLIRKIVVDKDGDVIKRKTMYLSESIRGKGDTDFDLVVKEINKLCNI